MVPQVHPDKALPAHGAVNVIDLPAAYWHVATCTYLESFHVFIKLLLPLG